MTGHALPFILTTYFMLVPTVWGAERDIGVGLLSDYAYRVVDPEAPRQVRMLLEKLFQAYENGDTAWMAAHFDSAMRDYQTIVAGVVNEKPPATMINIDFEIIQIDAGLDIAVVLCNWRKQLQKLSGFKGDTKGQSRFVLRLAQDGWRITALGGDNPFLASGGTLAKLGITKESGGILLDVLDVDMTGSGSLHATLESSIINQDMVLTEFSPGRFKALYSPSPLEAKTNTTLVLRYVDGNPGEGLAPVTLTSRYQSPGDGRHAQIGLEYTQNGLQLWVLNPDKTEQDTVQVMLITSTGNHPIMLKGDGNGKFHSVMTLASVGAYSGSSVTLRYLDMQPDGQRIVLNASLILP